MKEYPIIFSGAMVRAIIEGQKTQTRRVCTHLYDGAWCLDPEDSDEDKTKLIEACPYGTLGDRLWVRESFAMDTCGLYHFGRATWKDLKPELRWRPAFYLPRHMSRITLEVVNVRVEQVQDICEADATAEGCRKPSIVSARPDGGQTESFHSVDEFHRLWNSINAKRGYGWDTNPWVWVIEFRHLTPR